MRSIWFCGINIIVTVVSRGLWDSNTSIEVSEIRTPADVMKVKRTDHWSIAHPFLTFHKYPSVIAFIFSILNVITSLTGRTSLLSKSWIHLKWIKIRFFHKSTVSISLVLFLDVQIYNHLNLPKLKWIPFNIFCICTLKGFIKVKSYNFLPIERKKCDTRKRSVETCWGYYSWKVKERKKFFYVCPKVEEQKKDSIY